MLKSKYAAAATSILAIAAMGHAAEQPKAAPSTPIVDTMKTMAGQPIEVPEGPVGVVADRIVLPKGTPIGTHMHFWARYVYVQSGEVVVTLADTNTSTTFRAGQMIVEPLGKWHSVLVTQEAVLISVEQVPPGRCNTVKPPDATGPNDCKPLK
ncbi:hypothetical protein ATI61_119152 [Archangium gephyra]|uniref:Cupin type-2 domain-containing protein n=2 Tax=Archangium gephyra TaxID=48 RepID=A0ABX9JMR1_9BACT|nr:cupin domain-containing protein [Archangium gephyra]REG22622.1 hypothetical protein ATI61_119152 [Archangium gephyra]